MAPRPTTKQSINAALQERREGTQRERLLAGMILAANRYGYAGATVSAVIGEAGVSSVTFYEIFDDKDDCFLAAAALAHERLLASVAAAVEAHSPERAAAASIEALLAFAAEEPALARFSMNEILAGRSRALDARDAGIDELAQTVERAFERVPSLGVIPELPVGVMLGAVCRLLAARLRRGERGLRAMSGDLLGWSKSYARPAGKHRWRAFTPASSPARSPHLPATALRPPPALGPGRPRIPADEVAENQRQRILFATAKVVAQRGFNATTIGEIAKLAGLDARVFSRLFADPQEAFAAIHQLGFQELVASCAGAYSAGSIWPERVWEALRAVTQSVQGDPTLARVAFVEAHAAGAGAIQRVEDTRTAFTIFLYEGYRHAQQHAGPPRLALEAIVTAVFEVIYRQVRAAPAPEIDRLLPHLTHLCLTPFIGPDESERFIEEKLRRR
ncbi:MAG TPA: TetR/AcrR family transcriptional regulator [Solirubrobacteraceae bacterium]|nr:TetR/AcrR family transcriptional regulator [Solirubrobacteraceae bacterium]